MDEIGVGGLRIAYRRAGQGPTIVFLHGFFGDSRVWRPQFEGLADEFDVVAWDAPGCGHSSDPPETFRMPEYADCLAGFIRQLGLERPHLVGLSFGGALALELYRRHPMVPRTLVPAAAYAGWAGSLSVEVVEQRLQQSLQDLELPADQVVAKWIPGFLTESAPPVLVEEVAAIISDFNPAGMRVIIRALAEADLRDELPRIAVPTLLLYGDKDVRAPMTVAEELHARIPASRLVVIPGVGHLSNVEAAPRFNAEVRTFLRAVET
ncbi:MAG: alpha/beta hydrolase [Candidatus Nephthysia bennettiae]|uniref:Alpha/beta fold hydrolase n=1 Tax=Candidatus Nephthysia bennettiae TaxID=3127016 RepID=A0A934K8X1_9BACT|nr:alpha/beta fold hydrolase [Candidatus Dormibacteraeota bacterium]PZR90537.1 MAG: alpha/beta hydrolase [Candidatus Dormibacteraeota bacterium]